MCLDCVRSHVAAAHAAGRQALAREWHSGLCSLHQAGEPDCHICRPTPTTFDVATAQRESFARGRQAGLEEAAELRDYPS